MMDFSFPRARRLRRNETIRRMVRETRLSTDNLIYPMFVVEGDNVKKEIPSMPGVFNFSVDKLVKEAIEVEKLGIPAIILFGIPDKKDDVGSEAYNDKGIIQRAIRAIKQNTKLYVITDVCLCEYTSHGHCGFIKDDYVDNDITLELLQQEAVSHAKAGADMVAPSDMMDFRVMAIRDALDENGFELTPIMSYAVKYASGYYGPFRDAAQSTPSFGDRRSYQMDPANRNEAIKEAIQDIDEGADIIMVKPALAYMDIIRDVRENTNLPVACYNVSGEYAMLKAAARNGWIDEERVLMETMIGFRRAGADLILTYSAKDVAKLL